jgi:hypothetical protein
LCSLKENASQNYIEIPSHPSENDNGQENKQQMLVGMQRAKETLYIVGGNVN